MLQMLLFYVVPFFVFYVTYGLCSSGLSGVSYIALSVLECIAIQH